MNPTALRKKPAAVAVITVALIVGSATPASAIAHGEDVREGRFGYTAKVSTIGIPTGGTGTARVRGRWSHPGG
jgi:hypothetical protein